MNRAIRSLPLAALLLAGCSLVPDYIRPGSPVPEAWPSGPAYRTPPAAAAAAADPVRSADAIGWREFLRDPALQRLVEIALTNNRDLRIAALNVEIAQANYRAQRGDLFPAISASGSGGWSRTPAATTALGESRGKTAGVTSRSYSAGIGFTSYEIDLFGRLRAQTQQTFEQYLGYEETRRSTQISLIAQVVNAHLTLVADQELLELTRQTLASQEESFRLTQMKYDRGSETELTLEQARTAVDTARANLAEYTRSVAQDENALALLLGQPVPKDLPRTSLDDNAALAELPAGLPSEVLLRRPDVMAAEHNLIAANANIGAARAAFFPSVTLTANAGSASTSIQRLFAPGSSSWSFAPSINIPLFSGGTNEANLDRAKAERNVYVATYEQTIQTAFKEVANALAARGTYDDQIAATQSLVDSYRRSYRLSEMRFRLGSGDYLSTLDAQRSLYSAQQSLISLRAARAQNLVTLYKVLGGGVTERADATTAALSHSR